MALDTSGVSVVITCYNLERYIASSIDSVLFQDFLGVVQVIVVDDASTDLSRQIIRRYPQVELLELSRNQGVLLSTLAGIAHSRFETIFFLDGDDIWASNKLRLTMQTFDYHPDIGLITHDIDYINKSGDNVNIKSRPSQVLSVAKNSGELVKNGILNHSDYVWLGSAFAVRRNKVDLNGFSRWAANLPNPRETYQDWPLAYWCASITCVKCAYIDQKLMSYRLHEANYSGDARTVDKAVRNLRKGYFTAFAILQICRIRDMNGFPYWLSGGKMSYFSYMIDLYSGRRLVAAFKFARLQAFLCASSIPFLKEWIRFVMVFFLGADKFILVTKWEC